jgi:hypothetical protein
MKAIQQLNQKLGILIVFTFCNLQAVKAQNKTIMETQDKAALTAVIEDHYFKGIFEGDVALLGGAFHHDALLFGDIKGAPYAKTLEQYLEGVKNRQSPRDSGTPFDGKILSLHIVNSIAVAEARVTIYDFIYHDILSFHKINGNWVIVNKMLTDTSK